MDQLLLIITVKIKFIYQVVNFLEFRISSQYDHFCFTHLHNHSFRNCKCICLSAYPLTLCKLVGVIGGLTLKCKLQFSLWILISIISLVLRLQKSLLLLLYLSHIFQYINMLFIRVFLLETTENIPSFSGQH